MAAPAVGPNPVTTLSTPSGIPAFKKNKNKIRSKQLDLIKSKAGQFIKRETTVFITHKLLCIILQTQKTT